MKIVEGTTLWISVALYSLSLMAYIIAIFFTREKWSNLAYRGIFIGFIFQIITIASRWSITSHPPAFGVYENIQSGAFGVVLIFLIASRVYKKTKLFGFVILILVLISLGHGITSGVERVAFSAPYKSGWLFVHIGFGWLAYGSFVMATLSSIGYILKNKRVESASDVQKNLLNKIPDLNKLDDISLKFIGLGFIGLTGMMVSGAIWASSLWGTYFIWEPLQVWALISWIIYGILLHLRLTLGWKEIRAAKITVGAAVTVVGWLFGTGISMGVHTQIF